MSYEGSPQKKSSTKVILSGFIIMNLLVILFAVMALHENKKHADLNEKMYQHPFSVSIAVLEANGNIISMHRYMKDAVLANNKEELELAISLVEQHELEVSRQFELIKQRFLGDKEKINIAYTTFVNWKSIRDEVLTLKLSNQHRLAAEITTGKGASHVKKLNQNMSVLIHFARKKALEFKNISQSSYSLSQIYFTSLLVFTISFGAITAFFVILQVRKAEHSRNESEERFQALFNHAEVSIWSVDFSTVMSTLQSLRKVGIVDLKKHLQAHKDLAWGLAAKIKVNEVNNATLKLFGAKSQVEFLSQINRTFGSNTIEVFIDELCAIWSHQTTFRAEANLQTLDGKEIQVLVSFQVPSSTSNFRNTPISIVDISEHKKYEKKLKLSSRVFSDTHEGIVITDANGVVVDVNPTFSKITGYCQEDIIGKKPQILKSGIHKAEFYTDMWQKIDKHGYWQGEIWNRKKNGEIYAELLTISSLKDPEGFVVNYLGMFIDITHSKRQQESIQRMAHYDALTGLPNRALLVDRFNQTVAHAKRSKTMIAVCFLDLDDFKPVNDTFGHDVGDKLLVEVAYRLELAVRKEDTVSRLGGDEFAILLGEIKSITQCSELLERIIRPLCSTYFIDKHPINISASVGVSVYPSDGLELDSLLRHADQAMYQAKQEGKNSYQIFDIKQSQKETLRNIKLQEVKQALTNQELCLYYQPKVNMASGEIIGVEALIRWQHPEKGLISPIEFLPLIENTEVEVQVGDWVIEQAMAQLELLNEQNVNIEMSVNISSMQLINAYFFDNLSEALNRHPNIDSHYFNLEVLESSSLGNLALINSIISNCRDKLGVSIALDDFGTGYSSLSHLRKLPADIIKIDQSFVRDILVDPNDFAIIDGIIGLTRSFNRSVIAEGVESTEQGFMLLLMGCDNAQGYAISRPLPAGKLVDWIKEYRPNHSWQKSSNKKITREERRIKQLELILHQWLKDIEQLLEKDTNEPLDTFDIYCHFDKWIERLIKEQLFEESWVNQLEQAYNAMHLIAEELIKNHQTSTRATTNNQSITLHKAFNKTLSILALEKIKP